LGTSAEFGSGARTRASLVRELMPSLVKTLGRWYSMVCLLIKSRADLRIGRDSAVTERTPPVAVEQHLGDGQSKRAAVCHANSEAEA
jgi:hypothetical protein